MFQLIEEQAESFTVSALCQVLKVSKSGFYGYLKTANDASAEPLAKAVKEVFWRHRRRYVSRRIHVELIAEGKIIG
jgi:putative transposase